MRNWICLMLALVMVLASMSVATAENSLSDFSNRLLGKASSAAAPAAEEAPAEEATDASFGVPVRVNDPFFAKVRSSAYLSEDKYGTEANVMIEMKNVSGRTLYAGDATVTAYNEAGEVLAEETYAYVGPDMVGDGESLYIWDWFYDKIESVADVSYFEVTVETETSSYRTYEKIDAQALVSEGIAYALVENTKENDIYGLSATICVENADGVLLDIVEVSTGNAIGVFPGSTMILRDNVEDYANGSALAEGIATASAMYQVD